MLERWSAGPSTGDVQRGALEGTVVIALLCPYCAGSDGAGYGTVVLLGAMILLPFGITWIVTRAIKKID